MLRVLLQILLAILTLRIVLGIIRYAARIASRDPEQRLDSGGAKGHGSRAKRRETKPLVDRASAIDVPFTEERTEP